jgi:cytochrome c biogenesis factor
MQAVGPTQLIVLLVAVAVVAAASGFLGSVMLRRRKRRARGVFLFGFLCGVAASALLLTRRRIRHALGQVVGIRPRKAETRSDAYRLATRVLALTAGRSRS